MLNNVYYIIALVRIVVHYGGCSVQVPEVTMHRTQYTHVCYRYTYAIVTVIPGTIYACMHMVYRGTYSIDVLECNTLRFFYHQVYFYSSSSSYSCSCSLFYSCDIISFKYKYILSLILSLSLSLYYQSFCFAINMICLILAYIRSHIFIYI